MNFGDFSSLCHASFFLNKTYENNTFFFQDKPVGLNELHRWLNWKIMLTRQNGKPVKNLLRDLHDDSKQRK